MMGQAVFPFAQSPVGRYARGPQALLPRMSTAAVRIPDPRHFQIPIRFPAGHPQIYVHEGARQALERRLSQAHHRPVLLSVTDNRRQMITFSSRNGLLSVRLHHMFLDAPAAVLEDLVRYVAKGDRTASLSVSRFIHENGFRIRATRPVVTPLVTQGETHDLLVLFKRLNRWRGKVLRL